MRISCTNDRLRLGLARLLIVTACVAAWQAAVVARWVDPFFVSSPLAVAYDLVALFSTGMVWRHLWVTLLETLGGFSLGAVLGVMVGLALGLAPRWHRLLDPLLVAVYGLPRVALAPLFILWFGLGMLSKMVFGLSLVFFLVLFNTLAGVRAQRPEILDALRVMGATRTQILTKVTLPSIAPWVFAGLKSGLGMALLGAVLGEYVGGTEGLGWLIHNAAGLFQTTRVFSSLVVLVVLVVLLSAVLNAAEARLLHWRPVDRAW